MLKKRIVIGNKSSLIAALNAANVTSLVALDADEIDRKWDGALRDMKRKNGNLTVILIKTK